MTTLNTKSLIMGAMHSTVIPLGLAFAIQNIIVAIAYIAIVTALYETSALENKAGKKVFLPLAILVTATITIAIISAKGGF